MTGLPLPGVTTNLSSAARAPGQPQRQQPRTTRASLYYMYRVLAVRRWSRRGGHTRRTSSPLHLPTAPPRPAWARTTYGLVSTPGREREPCPLTPEPRPRYINHQWLQRRLQVQVRQSPNLCPDNPRPGTRTSRTLRPAAREGARPAAAAAHPPAHPLQRCTTAVRHRLHRTGPLITTTITTTTTTGSLAAHHTGL